MLKTIGKLRTASKVLVIDDERAFCTMLAKMLGGLGYKVVTSTSAVSTHLECLGESDIIFIDMRMPGMDGLEVLDFLAKHKIKSSIILMSGAEIEFLSKAESIAKRSDLSLIGVLDKPFREIDIRAILEAG
jgi:CheY-like chemotaxis protein